MSSREEAVCGVSGRTKPSIHSQSFPIPRELERITFTLQHRHSTRTGLSFNFGALDAHSLPRLRRNPHKDIEPADVRAQHTQTHPCG